jgi:GT2 family glycosyltransferase
LKSLEQSTIVPEVYVIDNGRQPDKMAVARHAINLVVFTHTPLEKPMGVAESWNWFIHNVPEDRIISNDDVLFAPESLQEIIDTPGDFISPLAEEHNAFSCFMLRDSCVEKVGLFDENISPGYGYFEDCDYGERMLMAGVDLQGVRCGVRHLKSQTLRAANVLERNVHHRKFVKAQENYIAKWGRLPSGVHRESY